MASEFETTSDVEDWTGIEVRGPDWRRHHQRGATLLETVLVMTVIAMITMGAVYLYGSTSLSAQVSDATRTLMSLQTETRALHQTQRDFGAAGTDITAGLVNSGAVQANLQRAGGEIVNQWEGQIRVTGNEQEFAVSFDEVPDDACNRLVPFSPDGVGAAGTGIIGITIEPSTTNPDTDVAQADTDGLTAAEAAALCVNDPNSITWHFSRT